jgi:hypothetical protein
MLDLGLLPEVFILGPLGFGQNGADDLIAFEGDFFSDLFYPKLSSWVGFWVTADGLPLQIARA